MSVVDKALWVIERNSDAALTLNAIADACDVSRSHLANAFGTATGWPVMKYLRARRLTEAAHRLAEGAPDILSLALRFGYGSHEAFTRAFRDHFGRTPDQVRGSGSVEGLDLTPPLELSTGRASAPFPRLSELGRLFLVGLAAERSYGETIGIPAQWQTFMANCYDDIPNKLPQMPIGLCAVPDDDGCFTYVCAAEVHRFGDRTKAMSYFETEAGPYAVFEHNDHVSAVFGTYTAIWNEALPAMARRVKNGPALEFHNEAFDPDTGMGGLTIWIPLEAV